MSRLIRNRLILLLSFVAFIAVSIILPPTRFNWGLLILGALCIYLLWISYRQAHPSRRAAMLDLKPDEAGLSYVPVQFTSRDGLELAGWYVPGAPGPAVILVHGRGASASHMLLHAKALEHYGCASLMFDLRAHGRSEGDTCTFGVREAGDVLAAVDYLRSLPEIDPQRIGALGVSLGAQAVLRAAASGGDEKSPPLRAILLDGLGPLTPADCDYTGSLWQQWVIRPFDILIDPLSNWLSGISAPESTFAVLKRLSCPLLFISTGAGGEQANNRRFYAAAHPPKALHEMPQALHAAAVLQEHKDYREQMMHFFQMYLGVEANPELTVEGREIAPE